MSQPDLLDTLRDARLTAPQELRERVRLIAAQAPAAPRRRITWRRSLIVLVPVAAAIAAAVVFVPRGGKQATPVPERFAGSVLAPSIPAKIPSFGAAAANGVPRALLPTPSGKRVQSYSASLELRLRSPAALAEASRRAVAIATSLSGYQQSVTLNAGGKTGYASIVLRIPRNNVRKALSRLSALGRVTSENVSIQDLQTQVNTNDQTITRLQRQLASLRTQPQTIPVVRQIAQLTARVEALQRARASTLRKAHYSTISLQLTTPPPATTKPHKPGPLHGLGIAFHWVWIGAVYALALGTPLLALLAAVWFAARSIRRRREESLLRRI